MEPSRLTVWVRRIAIALGVVVVLGYAVAAWVFSSVLDADLFVAERDEPEYDLEIATVGGGRVVLSRTDLTEQDGVWGLESETAYGQVTSILEVRDDVVERGFRDISGEFRPGDRARFEQYAYAGDPSSAHGIRFEEVRIAGELGAYPAWKVDGARDTWVIVVHGKGDDRRQALRMLPALIEAGFPVLVISYRNDPRAPPAPDGRYGWGREEWRDLDAALRFAQLQGASEFVLYGFSMGGAITSMFLHESDLTSEVVGVVWDSPVLDLEATVDAEAADRGIPGILTAGAKSLAGLRFDLDWREMDQVERAAEFDVPILLMHGTDDDTVPIASSNAFAESRPDLVTYERFDAGHVYLWNEDPVRYETALVRFLARVSPPLT